MRGLVVSEHEGERPQRGLVAGDNLGPARVHGVEEPGRHANRPQQHERAATEVAQRGRLVAVNGVVSVEDRRRGGVGTQVPA